MKKIFKTIGIGILVFAFFYLLGAFHNTSFDISIWTPSSRFAISLFGGCFSALSMVVFFVYGEIFVYGEK